MSIQISRYFSLVIYFNLLFLIPAGFSPIKLQQPDNQDKQLQQEVASASSYFYNPEDPFEYEDCDDFDLCDDYWYNGYGYPKDSKGSKDCADADAAESTENCAIKTATCSASESTENCAIKTATCSAIEPTEHCAIETATCSASESTIGHTTVIPDLGSAITCLIATELDGAIQTAIGRAALSHVGLSVDNDALGTSSLCKPTGSRGNVSKITMDPAITNAVELAIQTTVGNATTAIRSAVNHALELAVERNVSSTINRVVDCAVNNAIDAAISRSIGSLNGAVETATENAIIPVIEQTVDRVLGPAIDSAIASRSTDSLNRAITPAVMNIVDSAIDVAVERALVIRLEPHQIVSSHATLIESAVNGAVSNALGAAMDNHFGLIKSSMDCAMISYAVDSGIDAAIDFALTDAAQIAMDKAETIEPAVNSVVDHAFKDAIDRCITSVGPDIDRVITSRVGVAIDRALVAQVYPPQIVSDNAAIIEPD